MHCGVSDRNTTKCDQSGAPIHHLDGTKDSFPTCLWCGIRGHWYNDCLRRISSKVQTLSTHHTKTSQQTKCNKQEIVELRLAMTSLKKGLDSVDDL